MLPETNLEQSGKLIFLSDGRINFRKVQKNVKEKIKIFR